MTNKNCRKRTSQGEKKNTSDVIKVTVEETIKKRVSQRPVEAMNQAHDVVFLEFLSISREPDVPVKRAP